MVQPEDKARENIDRMLTKSGWAVQDPGNVHLSAYRGLAIRNFTLKQGYGFAYESTGMETRFANGLDPLPQSRRVFSFHRPDTLASWLDSRMGGVAEAAEK